MSSTAPAGSSPLSTPQKPVGSSVGGGVDKGSSSAEGALEKAFAGAAQDAMSAPAPSPGGEGGVSAGEDEECAAASGAGADAVGTDESLVGEASRALAIASLAEATLAQTAAFSMVSAATPAYTAALRTFDNLPVVSEYNLAWGSFKELRAVSEYEQAIEEAEAASTRVVELTRECALQHKFDLPFRTAFP